MDKKDELIKELKEYIDFLAEEIGKTAVYLHIHGFRTSDETMNEGKDRRESIRNLEQEIYGGETLKLTLERKWFEEILAGEKTVEYREHKPYWTQRLMNKDNTIREYKYILFKNGYSKDCPTMLVEWDGMYVGKSDDINEEGLCYCIKLGKIVETWNVGE